MSQQFWVVQNLATKFFLVLENGFAGLRTGWEETTPYKATLFDTQELAENAVQTTHFLGEAIEPHHPLVLVVIPLTITLGIGTLVPRKRYDL